MKNKKRFSIILIAIIVGFVALISVGGYFGYKQIRSYQLQQVEKERQAQELAESQQKALEKSKQETEALEIAKKEAEDLIKKQGKQLAQETLKRTVAEQGLKQKALDETRLNQDQDGDGLTLRQEIALGTSDTNIDSDGDLIIDGSDTHPAGGGRYVAQHFNWSYGGYNYTWDIPIQSDLYDVYRNGPRPDTVSSLFVSSADDYIVDIAKRLLAEAQLNNWCKACFAMAFIQSLPYVKDITIGYNDYPKYPIETIVEGNGDCEDTSYLAAAIIRAMDIDVALVLLPGHMAIAVTGSFTGTHYKLNNKDYYYYETTGEGWPPGQIPDNFSSTCAGLLKINNWYDEAASLVTVCPEL